MKDREITRNSGDSYGKDIYKGIYLFFLGVDNYCKRIYNRYIEKMRTCVLLRKEQGFGVICLWRKKGCCANCPR